MTDQIPRLERFFQQAARAASGESLHPLQILQEVQEAAFANVRDGAMPNAYHIEVAASDAAVLSGQERTLTDGIVRMLGEIRQTGRFSVTAGWMVELGVTNAVSAGAVRVEASFRNAPGPARRDVRGVTRPIARLQKHFLRVGDGERVALTHLPFFIGRTRDCDLVIADMALSRKHAVVERDAAGNLVLRDLGSSNGVKVGGAKVEQVEFGPGTEAVLGTTTLSLEVDP